MPSVIFVRSRLAFQSYWWYSRLISSTPFNAAARYFGFIDCTRQRPLSGGQTDVLLVGIKL